MPVRWDKKPVYGTYKAVTKITFSELDAKTNKKTNPQTVIKEVEFTILPWTYIYIALAVLLLIILFFVYRYVAVSLLIKKSTPYKVMANDTIMKLAKAKGVNWKKIAKINKLHAPYTLEEGKTILLPPAKNK
jgi:LysM repeat protein